MAVHRSAASLGATLTPGDIALERAGAAAARLDAYLDSPRVADELAERTIRANRDHVQRRRRNRNHR
jgi:hypothetical protein